MELSGLLFRSPHLAKFHMPDRDREFCRPRWRGYGAAVLGSPLIVVLAHTSCGAVKAACDVVTKNATYPGAIGSMIEPILPAALAVRSDPGDLVDNAAKESAKRTARRLTTASTLIAGLAGAGKLKIAAAIYDLKTGVVTYLD
jgi:carbonic anhydrase